MSLKLFEFSIKNTRTGETCAFLGQGEGIEDAFKDGATNLAKLFRPRDGAKRDEHGVSVTLRDGRKTNCNLRIFESDVGADPRTLPAPVPPTAKKFMNPYQFCSKCQGVGCDRCEDEHKADHRRAFPEPQPAAPVVTATVELDFE